MPPERISHAHRCVVARLVGAGLAVPVLVFIAGGVAEAETLEHCQKGMMAGKNRDFELAIENFSKCIEEGELTPASSVTAHYNRGAAYHQIGAPEDAIRDYTTAVELDPNHYPSLYNRATIFEGRGDFERAISDYSEVIRLNPNHPFARINRGNTYQRLEQLDQAIQDYDAVIQFYPQVAAAFYNRGNAYSHMGMSSEAIRDYEEAIRLDPEYAKAYYSRGLVYYQENKRDLAYQDYNKAINLDPGYRDMPYAQAGSRVGESEPAPTQTAATPDPELAATAGTGGRVFTLHFSSVQTDEAAKAEWSRLRKQFPELLGDWELVVRTVDIEGQGRFLRVLAGSFPNRVNAKARCDEFKSRQQYCSVLPLEDEK